jgi:hypothetical protein
VLVDGVAVTATAVTAVAVYASAPLTRAGATSILAADRRLSVLACLTLSGLSPRERAAVIQDTEPVDDWLLIRWLSRQVRRGEQAVARHGLRAGNATSGAAPGGRALGIAGASAVSGCQTLTWPVRFPAGWQGRATVGNLVPAGPGGVRLSIR